jgi:hypothetical protein
VPGPAKAFMLGVDDVGTFINPADSAIWLDIKFRVIVVGHDGQLGKKQLQVFLDPALTGAAVNAAIANVITAYATSLGNTLAANQIYLQAFNRV